MTPCVALWAAADRSHDAPQGAGFIIALGIVAVLIVLIVRGWKNG